MKLYPYKAGSKSAKALAEALGIKRIKHQGHPLVQPDVVINWGSSNITRDVWAGKMLNLPAAVALASNKLKSFEAFTAAGVSVPEWTESLAVSTEWMQEGKDVVVRHKLTGHSGEGIEIITTGEGHGGLTPAPLYTVYVKKDQEYRIHVFQDEAFFVQRKARKMDVPADQVNWKVRNLAGGFIFANKDVDVDDAAKQEAIKAVKALGLDFGAVDIILGKDGVFYVLEVNTACGLEGTTLEKYVEKFQQFK